MKAHTKTATAPTVAAENTRPKVKTLMIHLLKSNPVKRAKNNSRIRQLSNAVFNF